MAILLPVSYLAPGRQSDPLWTPNARARKGSVGQCDALEVWGRRQTSTHRFPPVLPSFEQGSCVRVPRVHSCPVRLALRTGQGGWGSKGSGPALGTGVDGTLGSAEHPLPGRGCAGATGGF